MKKITKRSSLILISVGMLVIAISQMLSQLIELPDLLKGSFIGVGIGLLITSLIIGKTNAAQ